ncbi:restriction endonuclease subunit S [Cereibacter sediminicola]|uniref:restriction endonuclease subunit S n=1 Tax=Cereibacter sediminicola TaxID=2584941 RepID=UPI0016429B9B|nr:restriction endonuclease subunit S [Cereibacter sediminicola]
MLEWPISKAGWMRVAFGDVVRLSKARVTDPEAAGIERVVGLEHIEPGDLRIRRWGDVADGTTFTTLFKPGQVLFGKRRAYQRKVAVADFEGVCSGDIYVLEQANDRLMPELLPFLCQTDAFFDHAVGTSAGSLSPRTNWTSLASFEFLLPPIQEQARLVDLLKGAESTTEALRSVVSAAKVLRQSTIDHFSSISVRPSVPLGEICEMQNGRPFPGDEYQRQGPRLLRPGNLGVNGYFKWDDGATVCLPARFEAEAAAFVVDTGDVVINLTAQSLEEGFMGRVCLAREGDRSLLNQRIGRFQGFSEDFQPEFVFRVLQSSRFQNHAVRMCEGSKIKHLFWQHLAPFLVPKLDLVEQLAIIETIRSIDVQIEGAQARLASAMLDRARLFDLTQAEEVDA